MVYPSPSRQHSKIVSRLGHRHFFKIICNSSVTLPFNIVQYNAQSE
jgi:hypothetical protein